MKHVPRSEVLEIQKKADLLLLLSSSKDISKGVLTGKIFEYMSSGRPIICIGAKEDFDITKLLNITNTGIVFGHHEIIKLEKILYDSYFGKGIFKNYKPNINQILKYSRKHIANDFLKNIKEKIYIKSKYKISL